VRLPTLGVVVALGATCVSGAFAGSVGTVDFSQGTGAAVKRVNGLCNTAPLKGNSNENDPRNYVFGPTDLYLAKARELGGEIAFRFFAELAHGGAERVACPLRPAKGWYAVASRRPDGEGRLMAAVYPADGGDGTAADEIRLALPGVEHVRIEGISRAFGRVPAPEGSFAGGVLTLRRPASGAGTFLVTVPKGSPFWNGCAKWFMAAPAFDFAEVKGAAEYAFEVTADGGTRVAFAADTPKASLASVWDKVPEKTFVRVTCTARDAAGKAIGTAGERTFFKTASFKGEGVYPAAKRPLREAAAMAFDYVFDRLARDYRERGEPNPGYSLNSYPSKMEAALIAALVRYAKMRPDRREEALKLARMSAAWLIGVSERADAPLAHFPPTYRGKENEAGQYAGQIMLLYPATVALAYLDLADATGEARWAEAAVRIGETYLKLQSGDGTWYLKMWMHDGSPVAANRCMPIRQMELFDRLAVRTQDARWREASARAFAWLENGPLVTWNWEGQFEDVRPGEPYANLTKHDACDAAQYLLTRFPKDARRVRQARELLAFSEDQVVMWERPCRADGKGPDSDNPEKESYPGLRDYRNWHAPSVVEQYGFAIPVDASSAKLIKTYLALDAVTPDPVLRAKARTLAAALTRVQFDSGCVPTILHCEAPDRTREKSGWCWRNCHVASAFALLAASQADR